jgi:hypothetical protein
VLPLGGVASREGTKPEVPVHIVTPEERAAELRAEGIAACENGRWSDCLERLDQAQAMDPAGDEAPEVREARRRAANVEEPLLQAKPR